mmetsp:Transcript_61089/g.177065  ORF Transcript_61089/g.177065 Transcript_61089/m.177065 type:complete len:181 (+) Transcript_61089:144-686(+)
MARAIHFVLIASLSSAAIAAAGVPRIVAGASLMRIEEADDIQPTREKCARCLTEKRITRKEFDAQVMRKRFSARLLEDMCSAACTGEIDEVDRCFETLAASFEGRPPPGRRHCHRRRCAKCLMKQGYTKGDIEAMGKPGHEGRRSMIFLQKCRRSCMFVARVLGKEMMKLRRQLATDSNE